MNGRTRVVRPTTRTRRPVANGSSVPACPTRRSPTARRASATTSCDVMPAGLSTRRMPSAARLAGVLIGGHGAVLDLGEQGLDAGGARDALVDLEGDLGGDAEPKRAPDARPE